jgi:hypothetical protein
LLANAGTARPSLTIAATAVRIFDVVQRPPQLIGEARCATPCDDMSHDAVEHFFNWLTVSVEFEELDRLSMELAHDQRKRPFGSA